MKKILIAVAIVAVIIALAILVWPSPPATPEAGPDDPLAKLNIQLPDTKPDPSKIANMPNPFGASNNGGNSLAVPDTPMAPAPTKIDTPSSTVLGRNIPIPQTIKDDCGELRGALMQAKITPRFVKKFLLTKWGQYYRLSRAFAFYGSCEAIQQHDPEPCNLLKDANENLYGECMVEYLMVEYLGRYLHHPKDVGKITKQLRTFSDIPISTMLADVLDVISSGSDQSCNAYKKKNEAAYLICRAWFEKDVSYCSTFKTPQGSLYCKAMVTVGIHMNDSDWNPETAFPAWPYNIRHILDYWSAGEGEKPVQCREALIDWLDRTCGNTTPF